MYLDFLQALELNILISMFQRACKEAMSLWGYKMANNETHMKSEDFMPLDNYTISQ